MSTTTIGSSAARESWIRLLDALLDELRHILPDANIVYSEEEFRTKFLELDESLHVRDPAVNYGIFGRYHDSVHLFARTIDDAIGLQTSPTLKELFWTVALAAIEAAFAQEFEFKELPAIYKDLTREFPSLTYADLSQYPQDIRVQDCLQKIFEAYLKCYLELVCQFDTDPDERDFQAVADQIGRASAIYAKQETKWKSVTEAARDEAEAAHSRSRGMNDAFLFERLRVLGRGSYGEVDVVRQTATGSVYARKQIPFNAGGTEPSIITERVKNEVEVMTRLRHHHIASVNLWFRAESTWTILMLPVAEYDLRTFLDEKCVKQDYPLNMLRLIDTWFGCLISALKYAHERRVKHEDIKPSNILVLRNTVYLTDFGTAKHFTELEASTATDFLEQGTPIYWAPEERPWGRPADVFALGCVFSEMLTVRQGRSLTEFREFRYTRNTGFGYAYRACLEKVIIWLRDRIGIGSGDPVAQTILEQTMNMLEPEVNDRPEAARVKRQLGIEPERLFCNICS